LDITWMPLMTGPESGGGSSMYMLVWFGLLFVLMYMLLIRPQRKKQKEHEKLLGELKKGDKVVTTSGMFGTIFAMDEEHGRVVLRINEQTKLTFLKSSIAARVDN
jgi:preprotein translocase subunit YajC